MQEIEPGFDLLKRVFMFCLGVFVVTLIAIPQSLAQSSQSPKMVLKEQIFDFKQVNEGEIVTHDFPVFNQGNDTLRIERVKTTCSCSVASFDTEIPAGGQGNITVKIDTGGFEGRERWGVTIFTNDPLWQQAVLDLRADVKAAIVLTGSTVLFSGKKNAPMTREVEISSGLDKPLTLRPEQFTLSGKVTYSLSEIEKEKRYRVSFQNVAGRRENYRGFLKLKTNFDEKPDVTIWVIGRFDK